MEGEEEEEEEEGEVLAAGGASVLAAGSAGVLAVEYPGTLKNIVFTDVLKGLELQNNEKDCVYCCFKGFGGPKQ